MCSADVSVRLELLRRLPVRRHQLSQLLTGAWNRRGNLRLVDTLYVELAEQLDAPIITTDERLAATAPTSRNSHLGSSVFKYKPTAQKETAPASAGAVGPGLLTPGGSQHDIRCMF